MSRPFLRLDRHPMYEEHREHGGWRIIVAGMVLGVLMALALAYGMATQ